MADQVEKICPFCQGIYLGSEIKRHISVEHLGIPKALQSKQQNNAEIQEEKKDLKKTEHSKQITGFLKCSHCQKDFSNQASLTRHHNIFHHGISMQNVWNHGSPHDSGFSSADYQGFVQQLQIQMNNAVPEIKEVKNKADKVIIESSKDQEMESEYFNGQPGFKIENVIRKLHATKVVQPKKTNPEFSQEPIIGRTENKSEPFVQKTLGSYAGDQQNMISKVPDFNHVIANLGIPMNYPKPKTQKASLPTPCEFCGKMYSNQSNARRHAISSCDVAKAKGHGEKLVWSGQEIPKKQFDSFIQDAFGVSDASMENEKYKPMVLSKNNGLPTTGQRWENTALGMNAAMKLVQEMPKNSVEELEELESFLFDVEQEQFESFIQDTFGDSDVDMESIDESNGSIAEDQSVQKTLNPPIANAVVEPQIINSQVVSNLAIEDVPKIVSVETVQMGLTTIVNPQVISNLPASTGAFEKFNGLALSSYHVESIQVNNDQGKTKTSSPNKEKLDPDEQFHKEEENKEKSTIESSEEDSEKAPMTETIDAHDIKNENSINDIVQFEDVEMKPNFPNNSEDQDCQPFRVESTIERSEEDDETQPSFHERSVIMSDQVEKICPFCQGIYLGSEIKNHISVEHLGTPTIQVQEIKKENPISDNIQSEDIEMKPNLPNDPEDSDSEPFHGFVVDLPKFHCQSCDKKFRHPRGFKKHKCGKYSEEDDDVKPSFHCNKCSKRFMDFHDLKLHVNQFHKSDFLNCKGCASKYELLEEHLEHQQVCSPGSKRLKIKLEKLSKCQLESKNLKNQSNTRNFKVKNPNDKRAAYQCEHCDKSYPSSRNLYRHMLIVHEGRRYTCKVCSLEFKEKYLMKAHFENVHEGIRHRCEYCDQLFANTVYLNQHMRVEHGVVDYYKCQECEEGFTRKEELTKHVKIVHQGSNFFRCRKCDVSFIRKENLIRHNADLHREVREE